MTISSGGYPVVLQTQRGTRILTVVFGALLLAGGLVATVSPALVGGPFLAWIFSCAVGLPTAFFGWAFFSRGNKVGAILTKDNVRVVGLFSTKNVP
jgi:hypothetical protein